MTQPNPQQELKNHLKTLPKIVQDAIVSGDVTKKLRVLAKKHKLHLDQWSKLENEIMFTLIGLSDPNKMAENVAKEVSVDIETAQALVNDIVTEIFNPIRKELEKGLDRTNPEPLHNREAVQKNRSAQPTTKENTTIKTKPTDNENSNKPSNARTDIEHDPYREPIE